jgi:hypothetical protein
MTQSKSRESRRRPVVRFLQTAMEPEALAVLRLTWYLDDRLHMVEEFVVADFNGGPTIVLTAIEQASQQGYDLTVLSEHEGEHFGDCYEV